MAKIQRWGLTWNRDVGESGLDWAVEHETADFLYGFTRMIKPMRILEIGTFEGTSAISMGKALKNNDNNGHLWTIDHGDYGQIKKIENENLEDTVTCIFGEATEALKIDGAGMFDFVFIDDGHSYEDATRDLSTAHVMIRQFGYILGHDVIEVPDVNLALNNFLNNHQNNYEKIIISSYTGLFILRKL